MQMKELSIMLTDIRGGSTTSRVDRIAEAIPGGNEWGGIIKMCVWLGAKGLPILHSAAVMPRSGHAYSLPAERSRTYV